VGAGLFLSGVRSEDDLLLSPPELHRQDPVRREDHGCQEDEDGEERGLYNSQIGTESFLGQAPPGLKPMKFLPEILTATTSSFRHFTR